MTEPRPKLTLVDAALEEIEPADPKQEPGIRKILDRYAPSIAKRARAEERNSILTTAGARTLDDLSMLAKLKQELREAHDREERKHVKAGYWRGFAVGGLVSLAVAGLGLAMFVTAIIDPTFDAALQARVQDDAVGMVERGVNPPAPSYPGGQP